MSGKLHDGDYKIFVPQIEAIIEKEDNARLLLSFVDFHGWDLHAAWDDIVFDVKHYSHIERVAVAGDRKWEKWMTKLWKPFTRAKVKYFDTSEIENAWRWVEEG